MFPAALLGRLVVDPLLPAQRRDARQHRPAAARAHREAGRRDHKIPFTYDDDVVKLIVGRCTELESGGRMIDAILTNTVLPAHQPGVPDPHDGRPGAQRHAVVRRRRRVRLPFQLEADRDHGPCGADGGPAAGADRSGDRPGRGVGPCRRVPEERAVRGRGVALRKILELVPDHPAATHYRGILAQQQGRLEEATALLDEVSWPWIRPRLTGTPISRSTSRPRHARRGDRGVPARHRGRSGPRQRAQQSRGAPAGPRGASRRRKRRIAPRSA